MLFSIIHSVDCPATTGLPYHQLIVSVEAIDSNKFDLIQFSDSKIVRTISSFSGQASRVLVGDWLTSEFSSAEMIIFTSLDGHQLEVVV